MGSRSKVPGRRRRNWIESPARQQKYLLACVGWMQLFLGRERVAHLLALDDANRVRKDKQTESV